MILKYPFFSFCYFQTSYITVEHNTGLEAYGDIILHGQFSKNDHLDFTVYEMKSPKDYTNDTFDVVEVNPNVYVTTAQVTSPFVHSTSSWSRDSSCEKDTSKFKSPQMHHKGSGD